MAFIVLNTILMRRVPAASVRFFFVFRCNFFCFSKMKEVYWKIFCNAELPIGFVWVISFVCYWETRICSTLCSLHNMFLCLLCMFYFHSRIDIIDYLLFKS